MIKLKLRSSVEATQPLEKRNGKNHKLPSSTRSLKIQDVSSCETFTQNFPSFQPIFQTFDKNVNLSKINPEAKKSLSCLPPR